MAADEPQVTDLGIVLNHDEMIRAVHAADENVSATLTVAAPAARVFAVLAEPSIGSSLAERELSPLTATTSMCGEEMRSMSRLAQLTGFRTPAAFPLVFVEVQHGDYFGEDDIVRLDDDYGRLPLERPSRT